jgi:pimeloyl-ACP methyl ester carboxylesterase
VTKQATASDKYVTVQGLKLHYRDWGNESAQPMLLLHGFTGNAAGWDMFAAAISSEYHVVALDQPGHGESDWFQNPADYTYEKQVDTISGFVDALGLGKMVLIGLSMGGRNAWTYALRCPEKVARLIIVDVAPETTAPTELGREQTEMMLKHDDFESAMHALAVIRFLWPLMDNDRITAGISRMKRLPNGRLTWGYDRRRLKARGDNYWESIQMPKNTWETLRGIQTPTLLIRGGISQTLSPELAERMCKTIPNCQFAEVPYAGHAVMIDNPLGFEAAVRKFLGVK